MCISPTFRSSRAWNATHTTATFLLKYQRNSAPMATPAVQISATPGSNGWKPTFANAKETWGKNCIWIFVCILHCLLECVNTTAFILCSSSGTDRIDFKFYDLLEQILDKQPSTSSTLVTDSIEISEDSNGESVTETGKISPLQLSAANRRESIQFYTNVINV